MKDTMARSRTRRTTLMTLLLVLAMVAGACSSGTESSSSNSDNADASGDQAATPSKIEPADGWCNVPVDDTSPSLTSGGQELIRIRLANNPEMPSYQLRGRIDPGDGSVDAELRANLPANTADSDDVLLRFFPGLNDFEANAAIDNVTVNGVNSTATLEEALITVPLAGEATDGHNTIELSFTYQLQDSATSGNILAAFTGESLEPSKVGLLGRTEGGAQLGHWFPVWLPPASRADANPTGFGDIGAFPAAAICAAIDVPDSYAVITGGKDLGTTDDGVPITGGMGLRDLAVLIANDLTLTEQMVDDVAVRVWGPTDDPASSQIVLDHAVNSHRSLTESFGPYPWTEIDVVSAPLGSGVGGMEWPGMVWVEKSLFAGGIPGLSDLGTMFEDSPLGDALGGFDMEAMLEDMMQNPAFAEASGGAALASILEWTVAHELGHEWWHAVVGNDSIASPAVDEPLAQFAACVAVRDSQPDNWEEICDSQTVDTYAQSRALGIEDAAADQASDSFESSIQYGAVVYGKAPGFYFEAADLLGWDVLEANLAEFIRTHPFELVATDVLRSHLVDTAGDQGDAIGALWDRWFSQAKGDEDIDITAVDLGMGDIDLDELLGEGGLGDLLGEGGLGDLLGEGGLEGLIEDSGLGDLTEENGG